MRRLFEDLPLKVQDEVKSCLHVYDQANVFYEYGRYHVSAGVCLKNHYGEDHEYIGTYFAEEIFSEEERIENYINTFYSYPINYKGKRDYEVLKKLQERNWIDDKYTGYKSWKGKLVNGNFEITEEITVMMDRNR